MGLPRGRVVEIFGPESSGKTTLTLQVIAECQKLGGTAAFVDAALVTGDAGTAAFEFFPNSASGTKKISFVGLVTNFEQSSSMGDVNTITITFKPSGTITSAI
mgnify:CR=1 FL=1